MIHIQESRDSICLTSQMCPLTFAKIRLLFNTCQSWCVSLKETVWMLRIYKFKISTSLILHCRLNFQCCCWADQPIWDQESLWWLSAVRSLFRTRWPRASSAQPRGAAKSWGCVILIWTTSRLMLLSMWAQTIHILHSFLGNYSVNTYLRVQ